MRFSRRIKSHHMGPKLKRYVDRPESLVNILDTQGEKEQVIYIHIPYCSNICSFCNMNRSLNKPKDNYIDIVVDQLKYYSQTKRFKTSTFSSVYFGGGTPSVLSEPDLVKILDALHKYANLEPDVEITMETSLSDLGIDKFKIVNSHGVNRLSIGIQTFSNRGRKLLNRRGDKDFAFNSLKEIRETGFENLNIDLIYNYFEETKEELLEDLRLIDMLDIAGFSIYSLIIMDQSKLGRKLHEYEIDESDSKDREFFDTLIENTQNYEYLELTKRVQKGRDEYKYIRQRLKGKDTFPLGAGAGGGIGNLSVMNPIIMDEYKNNVYNPETIKGMYFKDEYFELKRAIDTIQLLYYDPKTLNNEKINNFLDELEQEDYLYKEDGLYKLNDNGVFWGNNIINSVWDLVLED
ncbi:MAG: radical SAM protein [Tissierellia bacterium]|nr:radical SAM protein [Tissierellia bacterium]